MEGGNADPGSLQPPGAPGLPHPFTIDSGPIRTAAPVTTIPVSTTQAGWPPPWSPAPPREELVPPRELLLTFLEKMISISFQRRCLVNIFSTALSGKLSKCAFLPQKCPGKSPFFLRHQEARQTPLSWEHFVAQIAKPFVSELPTLQEPRTPQKREPRGCPGPGEHKSVVSGAQPQQPCGFEGNSPCLALAVLGLLPSPKKARGPACRCSCPRTMPQISNKNQPSAQPGLVSWAPETQHPASGVPHLSTP